MRPAGTPVSAATSICQCWLAGAGDPLKKSVFAMASGAAALAGLENQTVAQRYRLRFP
jgi:hypothetical protein